MYTFLFQIFSVGIASLHPSPTDSCPLWMTYATVAALPVKCSRHNTPSRSHSLTKVIRSCLSGGDEYIVVGGLCVCVCGICCLAVNCLVNHRCL